VGELLKLRGIGLRAYRGRKAKYRMHSADMHRTISFLEHWTGDIIHDCDARNHRITGVAYGETPEKLRAVFKTRVSTIPDSDWNYKYLPNQYYASGHNAQYQFEDGRYSCGCPAGIDDAASPESIVQWVKSSEWFDEWDADGYTAWLRSVALAGTTFLDSDGIMLPEFTRDEWEKRQ